jgi:hypothetical protein
MSRYWLSGICALALFCVCGCGSRTPADDPSLSGIDDALETPLTDLLAKSRSDLAALGEEWSAKVRDQEKAIRLGELRQSLLPELRVPLAVPVLREAKYSSQVGISLPPYAVEGKKDAELAVHLARHGDVDAALKLAPESDAELRTHLESFRGSRNYPVEWSRLVGLMLHSAEIRLATGDADATRELLALHRQLRKVLDAKTAEGPLGAALLGRGQEALTLAVPALRASGDKALAEKVSKVLADWGPVPSGLSSVHLGGKKPRIASILGAPAHEKAIQTTAVARGLDLLALPAPSDNCQAITALFDAGDQLAQVVVTYGVSASKTLPDPRQFGHLFEEQGLTAKDEAKSPSQRRCIYSADGVECQVLMLHRATTAGAVVSFQDAKKSISAAHTLPRDFGAVHLDRGFEQNRVRLAPERQGDIVQTKKPAALAQVTNPLVKSSATNAALKKESGGEATASLTLTFAADDNHPPLHQVALPLWQAFGPVRLEDFEDDKTSALILAWEDGPTRYALMLPNAEDAPIEFVAQNGQGAKETGPDSPSFDIAERKARIASGKPVTRLPRQLEGVRLGLTKEQALSALPRGASVLKLAFADGAGIAFVGDAPKSAEVFARQIQFRLDAAGKVAEVRVRYEAGPAVKPNAWPSGFLASWKKTGGAPAVSAAPAAQVWDDPPAKKAPCVSSWRDDLSRLTFYCDGGVADVTLRDCPVDHPDGVPLSPWACLTRGPAECLLGASKADLLKSWKVTEPISAPQVDLILYPPKTSRYDAYLIWFDADHATRIVARHRPGKADSGNPVTIDKALNEAWGRDVATFGWACRQEFNADQELQGVGWLDERTRVRTYWQETESGKSRVFTEWKELAAPAKQVGAK